MKKLVLIIGACIALAIALHVIVYGILCTAPQETDHRVNVTVKAVCDYSRDIQSGEAEEACGIAQDRSGTIYQCESFTAETATCTVERL